MKLTLLQENEIIRAKQAGLDEECIRFLCTAGFNYKQMEAARKMLEEGLPLETVRKMAHPGIPYEQMGIRQEPVKKPLFHSISDVGKICVVFCVIALSLVVLSVVSLMEEQTLELELSASEVSLSCNQTFQPENYIKTLVESEDSVLSLPKKIDTSKPGQYIVKYSLKDSKNEIQSLLMVKVTDDEAPVLTLVQDDVEVFQKEEFSCRAYILEAYDDVDGDMMNHVECNNLLSDDMYQTVTYAVTDRAGNKAVDTLSVYLFQAAEILERDMQESLQEQAVQSPVSYVPASVDSYTETVPLQQQEWEESVSYEEYSETYEQDVTGGEVTVSFGNN